MKLYNHQQNFINKNPNKALLVWDTGTGKSLTAIHWLLKRKSKKTLLICPKNIVKKWERELIEYDLSNVDILTYQTFKKVDLSIYEVVVCDEAHNLSSPLFEKGRSKASEKMYNFVKKNPLAHILLLTATPIRSTPYNIHTLACYLSIYWDIKKFRPEFFYFTDIYGRWHYEKRNGWQKKIRPYVEKIADIVSLSDCIDIPEQKEEIINIKWTDKQEALLQSNLEAIEPIQKWLARHRLENGEEKLKELEKIVESYQKLIVVCHYKEQIDYYKDYFSKTRQVFVLDGRVKDQDKVIEEAKLSKDCVFILQAQMGAGFNASEFAVMVFASMSFRYIDFVQAKGRILRIDNPHPNKYIFLLGGKCDNAVYRNIIAGKDFDVHQELLDR